MSDVPAVPGLPEVTADVFAPGGALSEAWPGFEARDGQRLMASRVAEVFAEGGVLLAEAGTGTGKTLAYLIPAILSRQRVLVSTGTKNLQEQIYFKDIPALREALGTPFTATCMKGRANYLCLHRLDLLTERADTGGRDVFLPMVRDWAATTDTGDRAELTDLPEELGFWSEVAATPETCVGADCPRHAECFVTRMRQRAAESDIVIVNHHLLCADASVRQNAYGAVIPPSSHVIVDEAHQLEDVATQFFGYAVSTFRCEDFARDIERWLDASRGSASTAVATATPLVGRLRDHARSFFAELAFAHGASARGPRDERVRVSDASLATTREVAAYLTGTLDLLEDALAALPAWTPEHSAVPAHDGPALATRACTLRDELRYLLRADDTAYVYFVEFRARGVFLRASPIDVSAIVRDLLVDRMRTTVLTSATLTVDGRFDYVRGRLGIADANEVRVPSEFDYARQSLLYLPNNMPDPREPSFNDAAAREVVALLQRSRGRAFVLFTSYASLRSVQSLAEQALDYPMLVQGTAPRSQLLQRFRDTPHSVLFATSSFWQGVDVAGEALSCVIIDKIPFASPGDPVTAARIDAVRAAGGEPFTALQVPLAMLALQQGLGRLLRHRTDRGVLAILDPRLRTKGYGRRFLASVPPAPVVHDLAAVEAFFAFV